MKHMFLLLSVILTTFSISLGQDAKTVLMKSFEKCQAVKNGYYEMTHLMKFMTKKDTLRSRQAGYFKKTDNDTLFSSIFNFKSWFNGKFSGGKLYSGDDFVYMDEEDSTATVLSKLRWAHEIKSWGNNLKFFSPLTNRKSLPLMTEVELSDPKYTLRMLNDKMIGSFSCYHIQISEQPENDTSGTEQTLRIEFNFWINKSDFIPLQYAIAYDMVIDNDTMCQYELRTLDKYEVNSQIDDSVFTLKSIPSYYHFKDFVPYSYPEPLPADTLAPDWELLSTADEKVRLSSLKGSLVLIDFFYKSCYPCMKALPYLQSLHEKYKEKGLKIVGVNPFDKKEDVLLPFFQKEVLLIPFFLMANRW